ncbi:hypothetical protein FZI91_07565 [Mycobacterium sp. CBMA271]|uniref:hypothetical protein n=1 Tax=unclassified Mycobacteroides TaxID=2618759 RepID=UPI0012DE280B|nr:MULTISPECIES: hypothetical protein [unclassified Mycobacteroides]MUM19150.1 hypothetical protein [Mycobacteroides sp. CBMA 326]MUM21564.1 hypothetical protein [Mycobacteroides sp. CBMA 271]
MTAGTMVTVEGHDFVAFDYTYEVRRSVGNGYYTETHNNMVTSVRIPRSRHWLRVGPERELAGVGVRVGTTLGEEE